MIRKTNMNNQELDACFEIIKVNMVNLNFDVSKSDEDLWKSSIQKNLLQEGFYFYIVYFNGEINGFVEIVKDNEDLVLSELQLSEQVKRTKTILNVIKDLLNLKEFDGYNELKFSILKINDMSNKTFRHLGARLIGETERKYRYTISRDDVRSYLSRLKY